MESLFNGKDLTGWKEFPGKKSKFSVTPEGAIHLKDGPGDLQTEGQWADFVLQLECMSNGKHCNSGVFFRCRPGEYQQGYEAQIHNGFTEEPKQEYTIEEYDPEDARVEGQEEGEVHGRRLRHRRRSTGGCRRARSCRRTASGSP